MNLAVLIGLALAFAAIAMTHHYAATAQAPAELCMDTDTRDKTRALMFDGINEALTRHTGTLFDNLLKDRGHDPDRMTRGMHTSLALYARSRENLLKWSPPACRQ